MCLCKKFTDEDFFPSCVYYRNGNDFKYDNPFIKENIQSSCYEFIEKYFELGGKETVLETDFKGRFKNDGKHIHTTVLYFLGCYLKSIIEGYLSDHIKQNIDIDNNNSWFDFRYTWFLCCLYHDAASVIEKEMDINNLDNRFKELDYYLGKNNIKYNVYNHIPLKPEAEIFTFPQTLVKNYFFYRADHSHSVDHGIMGGFLLFDRLIKNFYSVWKIKKKEDPEATYNDFNYKNLSWKIEHHDHFAIIADSIIAHNIWFNEDAKLYKKYGLDPLIVSPTNKTNIKERPLLFFLTLLDTIEPTKRFPGIDPLKLLNSIDVTIIDDTRQITIMSEGIDCQKYFEHIQKSEEWLDVKATIISKYKLQLALL